MTTITAILYWTLYFAIITVVLTALISVNVDAIKEGWEAYRCSAYLRLIRIKIKRSIAVRYSFEMSGSASSSI